MKNNPNSNCITPIEVDRPRNIPCENEDNQLSQPLVASKGKWKSVLWRFILQNENIRKRTHNGGLKEVFLLGKALYTLFLYDLSYDHIH